MDTDWAHHASRRHHSCENDTYCNYSLATTQKLTSESLAKLFRMRDLISLRPPREHSRFSISHTTRVIDTGLLLWLSGSVVFQYYLTQCELFVPFLQKLEYFIYTKKLLLVECAQVSETNEFRRSYYWAYGFCSWFSINIGRCWHQWVILLILTFFCLASFSVQVPYSRRTECCIIFLPLVQLSQQRHHQLIRYQWLHFPWQPFPVITAATFSP